MMMALSRNIGRAAASMREGKWERSKFTGTQLAGKTLAILGLGRIGQAVAQRARGLEMRVLGYDPFLSAERAGEQGIELFRDIDAMIVGMRLPDGPYPFDQRDAGRHQRGAPAANEERGPRDQLRPRGHHRRERPGRSAEIGTRGRGRARRVRRGTAGGEPAARRCRTSCARRTSGASTDEAQELVAIEAAEILAGFFLRNEVRHAVNMAPISAKEMQDVERHLDLARRLGLLLAQQNHSGGLRAARIHYRGEAAAKKTKLMTASFAAGLLETALEDQANIVNAEMLARERGIEITESASTEAGNFSTLITASIVTEQGELTASGTTFGHEFLRLVRLGNFHLDAYLDGLLLIYRHRDVPGLIGFIGTILGKHRVNIAHMALGRERNEPGGDSIAVLNLDNAPSPETLNELAKHPDVQGVELVRLAAGRSAACRGSCGLERGLFWPLRGTETDRLLSLVAVACRPTRISIAGYAEPAYVYKCQFLPASVRNDFVEILRVRIEPANTQGLWRGLMSDAFFACRTVAVARSQADCLQHLIEASGVCFMSGSPGVARGEVMNRVAEEAALVGRRVR